MAYAAKARVMAEQQCDWYQDAATSFASQRKDQDSQEGSGPSEREELTLQRPGSFAPLDIFRETPVFGGLAADTAMCLRPSLTSSMPTFEVSFRQNHFTGNQSDENSQARKRANALERLVLGWTRHGLPAHLHSGNHLEEEFEFDLSDMEISSIQGVDRSSEELEEVMGYIGVVVPADGTLALIQWCMKVKEGLRPFRTRFQIASFRQEPARATHQDIFKQRQSQSLLL
ncbi:hypothetical protein KC361_g5393 [Hortaea werneckii]|nr:hypothetical protein KC361_g5393 [Hortaea werneckii]